MATTRTSSASGTESLVASSAETYVALFDELEKIAEDELKKNPDPKWKRVLKAGALTTAGAAAGYGAGMLVDEGLRRAFKDSYQKLHPATKLKVLPIISGALGLAATAAQQYGAYKYKRRVEGDE
jgi:hypothetical protein